MHQTFQVMNINENIIIIEEVINNMKLKTGKVGVMIVKVDLEKAYDRL